MKLLSSLFALIICVNLANAQKRLSAEISTKTFDYTTFEALNVSDDFKVNITFAATAKPVVVRANKNLMPYVHVEQDDNTLILNVKSNNFGSYWTGKEVLEAEITIPYIKAFNISGDAIVKTNGTLQTSKVSLNVKSDGVFSANLAVDKLMLNGRSDADIQLSGEVGTFNATIKSDTKLKAHNLTVKNLTINLSGDSDAEIKVTDTLYATASGDSYLKYYGNPKVIKEKATGDSDIRSRG
ncbi:head GIN domain-containing protein [Spongiivirga sp. MCCC 1A20706]|uniref:head GIN domain-containing protein n=1 Tax=Spongiivirga sp. MCCC 1A20706 TaxID=3160963 RepID=UPI0039773C3A